MGEKNEKPVNLTTIANFTIRLRASLYDSSASVNPEDCRRLRAMRSFWGRVLCPFWKLLISFL
jgi:hypothetical protein